MLQGDMNKCHNISDLRFAAQRRAHRMVFDYIDGAADDEQGLRNNSDAFSRFELVLRILTGVDKVVARRIDN